MNTKLAFEKSRKSVEIETGAHHVFEKFTTIVRLIDAISQLHE